MINFQQPLTTENTELAKRICSLIVSEGATAGHRGRGAMLATEIYQQLHLGGLREASYEKLKKWCEMRNRMPVVEGHFRQLSRILYGKSLER